MTIDKSYRDFIDTLKQKIAQTKNRTILSVNQAMITLYFEIGKEIVQKQESLGWGKSVVEKLADDLQKEFGVKSGYSSANLWRMRIFYVTYKENPKLAQLVREIPWSHNIVIFQKCKNADEQAYYIDMTIKEGWSRKLLLHHIKSDLYTRDAKVLKQHNFEETLSKPLSQLADEMIKSDYNLSFLNVTTKAKEYEVEQALLANIKPEYAGKMNFYLNLLNDTVKMPHENPSIGIILCTDKKGVEVEYALQNIAQPMGVSTYSVKTQLPQELEGVLPEPKALAKTIEAYTFQEETDENQ